MLKVFKQINPLNLLFIDIETRSQVEKLEENTKLYDLVEYTCSRMKDFEESMIPGYYDDNAALSPELGSICTISVAFIHNGKIRVTSFYGEDEGDLLREFNGFLHSVDGKFTTTCTFAGGVFDIPFILVRMMANGIFDINAILDESLEKPWTKKSVDLKELSKLGRYSSPSLLGLCTVLGVESPKEGITGKDVSKAYFAGRLEEIKEYCERDTAATANCLLALRGEPQLEMEVVKITKRFQEEPKEYKSELDKLFITKEADVSELAVEGAKLTKKEQAIYVEITKALNL